MTDEVSILYSNEGATAMCLLPTALDDDAVPLSAAAGNDTAVLIMLELVWLYHYLIYPSQWVENSSFSFCRIVLPCINSFTISPQIQDEHQWCSRGNSRSAPKWKGKRGCLALFGSSYLLAQFRYTAWLYPWDTARHVVQATDWQG